MAGKEKEVIVVVSFSAIVDGQVFTATRGQTITMPPGMDWIKAGLVRTVSRETATKKAAEQAVIK